MGHASPDPGGKPADAVPFSIPPLALYIHFPWCERKCPYCDFNSHQPTARGVPETEYVRALIEDLEAETRLLTEHGGPRPLQSIFLGGGTPSLFSPASIAAILDAASQQLEFVPNIEITLEANPGTTDSTRFSGYRQAGVNRLSLGFQSLQDTQLQRLGRIHSAAQAVAAFGQAREAGFANINVDLMHGLPEQSREDALQDLEAVLTLAPEHLSWYQLTIEPNTAFYRSPPTLPFEETLWDIQQAGHTLLVDRGYQHYEISAYARPGQESRHNLNYWTFGDYLALGAGAHGKLTDVRDGRILRYWKTRQPDHYLRRTGHFIAGRQLLEDDDLPFEFMMNALRLINGVPTSLYLQRTGRSWAAFSTRLEELRRSGLLTDAPGTWCCTPRGQAFLNDVLVGFLNDEAELAKPD